MEAIALAAELIMLNICMNCIQLELNKLNILKYKGCIICTKLWFISYIQTNILKDPKHCNKPNI